VTLSARATTLSSPNSGICTIPPAAPGISSLIIRLSNPHADGLNHATNRVRARIDRCLESNLGGVLAEAGVDMTKRVLVHGDLSTSFLSRSPASSRSR
jgi:hypothetical protein